MPANVSRGGVGSDPLIGTVIASLYRVVDKLGEGGIGRVYAAEYVSSRERIALKVLRPEYSRIPEVVARFEREVKAMAGLGHENIVRALDYGRLESGDVYMVMELAQGETLRALLNRRGTVPIPQAVAMLRQIAAALTRAHSLGVIHRDLKPENVVVADGDGPAPRLKVLDFGMARAVSGQLAGDSPLTRYGSIFGSPSYMPPEQALGRPVDAQADQYALGVIAFEMLAGRRPFEAEAPLELLQMQVHSPPPALVDVAPGVPLELGQIVQRMLSKRPTDRFVSVARAMSAIEEATGFQAPGTRASTQPAPAPQTRPTGAAGAPRAGRLVVLTIAVLIPLLAIAVGYVARRQPPAPSPAPTAPRP